MKNKIDLLPADSPKGEVFILFLQAKEHVIFDDPAQKLGEPVQRAIPVRGESGRAQVRLFSRPPGFSFGSGVVETDV